MNEFDLLINQYLEELPEENRRILTSSKWQQTAGQIALKYSLSNTQRESMIRQIWITLIGGGEIEELKNELKDDLVISSVLANQLYEEINERIIKPILVKIEEILEPKEENVSENENFVYNSLDVPPDNLPTDEIFTEKENQIVEKEDMPTTETKPQEILKEVGKKDGELDAVYTNNTQQTTKPETKQENPKPFDFNQKLNNITTTSKEPFIQKTYTSDPYREPLE